VNTAEIPGAGGAATQGSVAGVVVLYHPEPAVEANIRSYLPALDLLILVDNSPQPSDLPARLRDAGEKVLYVGTGGVNVGIAAALNIGAAQALARGFRWLLTMDQDSRFDPGGMEALIARAEAAARDRRDRVGIVSPWHEVAVMTRRSMPASEHLVPYAFTSGNLLNLDAYRAAGPFLEKLFIDFVDFEYCLRLRGLGYGILAVPVRLRHSLGSMEARRLLGREVYPGHRSPVRYYYMTRNRLFVWKAHPAFAFGDAKAWAKTLLTLLLFERDRAVKLRYMLRGVLDFARGRYGAYR
jgi:rhamnosyltransferase